MKKATLILLGLFLLLVPGSAFAQLTTSSSISVSVNVTVNSSITLTQSGGTLVFNPATGATNQITFSTSWSLGPASSVTLYTWFSSPTAALSTGPSNIPASQIAATWTSTDSNGSGLVCTAAPGVGNGVVDGAACPGITQASIGAGDLFNTGNNNGTRNTTFSLSILNFATYKPTIAAGVYTGTLNALVLSV